MAVANSSDLFKSILVGGEGFVFKLYDALGASFGGIAHHLLLLYILSIGFMIMQGRFGDGTKQWVLSIPIVSISFAIAFTPGIFKDWIFDPVYGTSLDLVSFIFSVTSDPNVTKASDMVSQLQNLLLTIGLKVVEALEKLDMWSNFDQIIVLFFSTGIIMILFTIFFILFIIEFLTGVLGMFILLAAGAPMIAMAAFPMTRHLFFSWLKAVITHALIPVFAAMVVAMVVFILVETITGIPASPSTNADDHSYFLKTLASMLGLVLGAVLVRKSGEFASYITSGTQAGGGGLFGAMAAIAGGAAMMGKAGMGGMKDMKNTGGNMMNMGKGAMAGLQASQGASAPVRAYSAMIGALQERKAGIKSRNQ